MESCATPVLLESSTWVSRRSFLMRLSRSPSICQNLLIGALYRTNTTQIRLLCYTFSCIEVCYLLFSIGGEEVPERNPDTPLPTRNASCRAALSSLYPLDDLSHLRSG